MRVDAVSSDLIQCLREGEDRTVAIAPEAGSERLRRMVKKGYTEEEIFDPSMSWLRTASLRSNVIF